MAGVRGGCVARLTPGGHAPCENRDPSWPPNETGGKVARLHNTCIYSVASYSWCQKLHHSLNHVLYHPELLAPKIEIWQPRWPPQTAAVRNTPGLHIFSEFQMYFRVKYFKPMKLHQTMTFFRRIISN